MNIVGWIAQWIAKTHDERPAARSGCRLPGIAHRTFGLANVVLAPAIALSTAGAALAGPKPMAPAASHQAISPPPGDAEEAVRSEWRRARDSNNADALRLFIARHPESDLADEALARLKRLSKR